jgi:hypothetical protein
MDFGLRRQKRNCLLRDSRTNSRRLSWIDDKLDNSEDSFVFIEAVQLFKADFKVINGSWVRRKPRLSFTRTKANIAYT